MKHLTQTREKKTQPSGTADFYLLGGMLPVDIVEDIRLYRFYLCADAFDFFVFHGDSFHAGGFNHD